MYERYSNRKIGVCKEDVVWSEKHTGGTHENAGICVDCKTKYQTHEKSEELDSYESNNSTHTPTYKCTFSDCEFTHTGESKEHRLVKWNDKCKECDAIEKKSECSHIHVKKENSTQHWEECKKCGEVKAGTLKNHEFKDYKDNKDGTHSATCSECNYKLTEKHSNDSSICQYCKVNTSSNGGNSSGNKHLYP